MKLRDDEIMLGIKERETAFLTPLIPLLATVVTAIVTVPSNSRNPSFMADGFLLVACFLLIYNLLLVVCYQRSAALLQKKSTAAVRGLSCFHNTPPGRLLLAQLPIARTPHNRHPFYPARWKTRCVLNRDIPGPLLLCIKESDWRSFGPSDI